MCRKISRGSVVALIRAAIEELNEGLDYEHLREVCEDTVLFGGEQGIDSLSLVNLVVTLESEVQTAYGNRILLADRQAMSMRNSPYRTVGSLTDLILDRLENGCA